MCGHIGTVNACVDTRSSTNMVIPANIAGGTDSTARVAIRVNVISDAAVADQERRQLAKLRRNGTGPLRTSGHPSTIAEALGG
jgi:hypothetical protein